MSQNIFTRKTFQGTYKFTRIKMMYDMVSVALAYQSTSVHFNIASITIETVMKHYSNLSQKVFPLVDMIDMIINIQGVRRSSNINIVNQLQRKSLMSSSIWKVNFIVACTCCVIQWFCNQDAFAYFE